MNFREMKHQVVFVRQIPILQYEFTMKPRYVGCKRYIGKIVTLALHRTFAAFGFFVSSPGINAARLPDNESSGAGSCGATAGEAQPRGVEDPGENRYYVPAVLPMPKVGLTLS